MRKEKASECGSYLWSMYSESYIVTDIRDIFLFGDLFFKKEKQL